MAAQHAEVGQVLLVPALLLVVLVLYWIAALWQRLAGRCWSSWRTASFTLGVGLLGLAVSAPVAAFAHHDLRGHMLQHLLLGMFAPLPLVLGAPGTLLLRSLPVPAARGLVRLLGSRPLRGLIHPVTALLLDIGGMYVLYLTPLYAATLTSPLLHRLVHVHFVLSGYLFTWAIVGPDPAPHRPGLRLRLAVLFLATASHATLAKLMYAYGWPRGTPHGIDEIHAAAQWMYYGGDAAELLLIVVFFAIWFRAGRAGSYSPLYPRTR